MKSFWLIALIVVVSLVSATRAEAERFEERAALSPGSHLEVSNVSGSVEIRGWDKKEIEVIADIESTKDRLEFEIRDDTAFVGIRSDRDDDGAKRRHRGQHEEVDFVISVPRSTRVTVNTVSADIDVLGTTSDQRLESVSGDVTMELKGTEAAVRTVSGDIDVTGDDNVERMKINTVSGDAELRGVGGELRVESVSGDLDVTARKIGRLLGKTVNGDFELRGKLEKGGEIDLGAINGDIDIELTSLSDIEFDLESFNGDIRSIFGYEASRKSRYAPGRILRLTEGDGNSRIRIETLNGDIRIRATGKDTREPRIRHTPGRYDEVSRTHRDNYNIARHGDIDIKELEAAVAEISMAVQTLARRLEEEHRD